ncbi:3b0b9ddb-c603-4f3b-a1b1-46da4bb99476 [Thermothielavioides terrestris]|uniref:3b0b9ddb-c603-4f3b-a1b1-46da4bb99476 n=1 Tax=Thermothielavioides terrestris TaxID=2587410 RepID=A0A446BY03_9PEZI|nr:3b0b9ddb-c603-4f3b-a1b1-46da4bb99476 [Thermothielavioides terrestris]
MPPRTPTPPPIPLPLQLPKPPISSARASTTTTTTASATTNTITTATTTTTTATTTPATPTTSPRNPPRRRPVPTHFLCIPLATAAARPQLAAALSAFRRDACAPAPTGFGLPPDAVRPVGTVHLTLGLEGGCGFVWGGFYGGWRARGTGGDGRKQAGEPAAAAVAGLRGGLPKGLGDRGPRITLRGLVSMQAPKQAAVLYAPPVDQFGLLQAFCERVRDVFREADLMVDDGRPLLLHATVVNTVYVKGGGREANSNEPGEGSSSNRYEDQVWMEDVPVSKVAICKMGAKKVVIDGEEDEAYEVDAEVAFE